MIARLQVFYGGRPMDWLRMPLCVLRSYLRMLPRLRAERALEGVSVALVASGNMRKGDAQDLIGEWQAAAQDGAPRRAQTDAQRRDQAARLDFDVEVVPG